MLINLNENIYSYNKYLEDVKALSKQYKDIVNYVTIGMSHDNRDIVLLKLGYGHKYIACCGGVHGRETINTIVLMKIIEYYAKLYYDFKDIKVDIKRQLSDIENDLMPQYEQTIFGSCIYELLQTYTFLFIPLLNPDGYMISLSGYDCINNTLLREKCISMNTNYTEWKFNARGVDINRNFPSKLWKPSNANDYASSENETRALILAFNKYKPKGFIDFHSRGKVIYYYRSMMSKSYNKRQLQIALQLKEVTNYELVPPEDEIDSGDSGGNTVHYFSEYFSKIALTVETVDEEAEFPINIKYRHNTFEELKLVMFKFGSLII